MRTLIELMKSTSVAMENRTVMIDCNEPMTTKPLALKTMVQQMPACNKIRAKDVAEQMLMHECNLN